MEEEKKEVIREGEDMMGGKEELKTIKSICLKIPQRQQRRRKQRLQKGQLYA